MCLFRASYQENQALNSLLFFLGSVVIIVVLSKAKLYPLCEVCVCKNDVSLSCRIAAWCSSSLVTSVLPVSPT